MRECFVGGTIRTIVNAEAYIGGQWRRLASAEAFTNAAWRAGPTYQTPITVSVSPTSVSGTRTSPLPSYGVVKSNTTTATPSGGRAPFSYVWAPISGTAQATSPNSATTAFSAGLGPETAETSIVRVTVTDSAGSTATADVSVTLTNFSNA